jgi:hypothetical protein
MRAARSGFAISFNRVPMLVLPDRPALISLATIWRSLDDIAFSIAHFSFSVHFLQNETNISFLPSLINRPAVEPADLGRGVNNERDS